MFAAVPFASAPFAAFLSDATQSPSLPGFLVGSTSTPYAMTGYTDTTSQGTISG